MLGTNKFITLEAAKKMMAAGETEARKNGWNVAITIVDAHGGLEVVYPDRPLAVMETGRLDDEVR